ncbi:hypothetical protein FOBRF1_015717 [Fusarium oxysporum]
MAATISASVPSSSVGTVLVDIDDHSRNPRSFNTPEITIGPFGVFDASPDRESATAATFNVESNADADATVSNTDPATDICDWDGYIIWDDLFTLDNENTPWMPPANGFPLAKKFAWGPMHHELAVQTLAEVTFLKKPEALMAHAWVTSIQTEARRFQLEAERLVRFRGLSKRNISRRIRLLHHAYTWNRIVGESTYVLHDYGTFQHAISASVGEPAISDGAEANIMANESSSHNTQENTRLDDFLRIGHRFEEIGSHLEGHKDAQAGIEDIHLEDPRTSVEDGFHVIYGIPEQWLSLLSCTTRLANWLDATEIPQRLSNNRLVEILERRAQSLEDAICSFVESRNLSASIDANDPPNVCMFRCLTAALLIFFYRRIRNVHPLVLQVYVDQIIRGLEIFDDSLARHGQAGPGSAWAAFIAGCEAMGESRREKLRQWMDRAFDSCRFQLYQRAKELMTRVWERRSMAREYQQRVPRRPSWMEVSRETNTWIILN